MKLKFIAVIGLLLATAGCYPEYFESTSETDVVMTIENPDIDYQTFKTYVLADKVYDLEDVVDPPVIPSRPGPHDEFILKTVDDHMKSLGYVLEEDPETNPPDVGVWVGTVVSDNWYWYYFPIWDPWWGLYPPVFFPPVGLPANYSFGTMIITIAEIGDRMPDDPVELTWFSVIDGLLSNNQSFNQDRIKVSIDQAFAQSPYLELEGAQ